MEGGSLSYRKGSSKKKVKENISEIICLTGQKVVWSEPWEEISHLIFLR